MNMSPQWFDSNTKRKAGGTSPKPPKAPKAGSKISCVSHFRYGEGTNTQRDDSLCPCLVPAPLLQSLDLITILMESTV